MLKMLPEEPRRGLDSRRLWALAWVITLLSCRDRSREAVARVDSSPGVAVAGVRATAPSGAPPAGVFDAGTRAGSPATIFAVDEIGISIGGQRIDFPPPKGAPGTLEQIVAAASPGHGAVSLRVARGATTRSVSALMQALGKTGVEELDVVTASSGAEPTPATLKVSPLWQVPEHEDRCGAQISIRADGTGELQYLQRAKVTKLPPGPPGQAGPDVSSAIASLRARMKGCGSTVWMLAGDRNAVWGPAFDVGVAVVGAQAIPGARRYIMVL